MVTITPLYVLREDIVSSRLAGSSTDKESQRRKFRLYMQFSPAGASETLDLSTYGAKTIDGIEYIYDTANKTAAGTSTLTISGTTLTLATTGTTNTCVVCGV